MADDPHPLKSGEKVENYENRLVKRRRKSAVDIRRRGGRIPSAEPCKSNGRPKKKKGVLIADEQPRESGTLTLNVG